MPTGVRKQLARGFALPTILIASIVMLIVLLASVSSTAAVRNAILNQYYSQLALTAGEAGVEYAKACLNQNAGVPLWNDANPLKPNTNCSGVPAVACPTTAADSRCAVTINGNVRSSFSIGLPGLDADDKAKTIPNTGYVEILRTSNNAVWRTYNQPSTQAAVVPDLCAGTATSALGWTNAVKFSSPDSFPESTASKIGISTGSVDPGPVYFRKDFTVTKAGTYNLKVLADNYSDVYIDNAWVVSTNTSLSVFSASKSLSVGCHTVMVKLTNAAILVNPASLMFSLKANGSSKPLVVSDTSWRKTAGPQRHYSEVNYYADPASWTVVRDVQSMGRPGSTWPATSGDSGTRSISTTHSYNESGTQFTLFRDNRIITIDQAVNAKITMYCNDACYPYVDGNLVNTGISLASGYVSFTVNLTEGQHKFAFLANNSAGGAAQAQYALAAVDTDTGALVTHTDKNWSAANFWSAANPGSSTSYDNTYKPNPNPLPEVNVAVLAVGGGGSGGGSTGGGGGAGGVVSSNSTVGIGSYTVVVGSGGAAAGTKLPGNNGASSSFNGIIALGGGGGGYSADDTSGAWGMSGGSGGGGQNYYGSFVSGAGALGQGNAGGPLGNLSGSGGGGAGGIGGNTAAAYIGGAGGPGVANSITGAAVNYGGGGGGGGNAGGAGGIGGGGTGATGSVGSPGVANTGGGGGGGWSYANGVSGAGGSGVVIIRYLTSSMSATGGTITTAEGYTIHRFTSSGTFTITEIKDVTKINVARGVNLAPNYSSFSLTGNASYNSSTGVLTLGTGSAVSPLILVNKPTRIIVGGDFYVNTASANAALAPKGGWHISIYYYGADGTTLVYNSAGYQSNGCAQPLDLGVWRINDQRCGFSGGPNVIYTRYTMWGSAQGYSSSDLNARNAVLTTN